MNYYPNYMNPYFNNRGMQQYTQQIQPYQPQQYTPAPIQATTLQGKLVDSFDMVKTVEFPFDGSVSYFPLTDGSAIVTKQLQMDGTAKTIIYKPVEENKSENKEINNAKNNNDEELTNQIKMINKDNENLIRTINNMEEQISELSNNFKEFLNDSKSITNISSNVKGGKK